MQEHAYVLLLCLAVEAADARASFAALHGASDSTARYAPEVCGKLNPAIWGELR